MTPRPPPSAEHFTQVVTEVDRLVQQGCAEISALSRMALLWLETPETSNRLDVLASALRTIRNSADMLASETSGEVVAVGAGTLNEKGDLRPLDVKAGDRILFGKWSGTEVKVDGEDLLIMKESDILGVVEG